MKKRNVEELQKIIELYKDHAKKASDADMHGSAAMFSLTVELATELLEYRKEDNILGHIEHALKDSKE